MSEKDYIDLLLVEGNYDSYFNNNYNEIKSILNMSDPLEIREYAREKAKTLTTDPEDVQFYEEEILLAIEDIQTKLPQFFAAVKLLQDKYTVINGLGYSIMLYATGDKLKYVMINDEAGKFNKNQEIFIPQSAIDNNLSFNLAF
jgi:hypothetical protein